MTGTWHVRAFTDPKRPPVGDATFMVEDYVPDRIEFDLTTEAKSIPRTARRKSSSTAASSTARPPPVSICKAQRPSPPPKSAAAFPVTSSA